MWKSKVVWPANCLERSVYRYLYAEVLETRRAMMGNGSSFPNLFAKHSECDPGHSGLKPDNLTAITKCRDAWKSN
jgi:hypothetical protein